MQTLKGEKFSFRVDDPEIANILRAKKQDGKMSAYINDALRFYYTHETIEMINTIQQLAQAIQTLVETRDALISGGEITLKKKTLKDESEELIDQMLANSIGSICNF